MKNKKLEAIQVLHDAFEHHPEYKKKWQDFIELTVTEELAEAGIHSIKKIKAVRTGVAKNILRLFDPIWWEAQEKPKNNVDAKNND
jgi:hypothetical protein